MSARTCVSVRVCVCACVSVCVYVSMCGCARVSVVVRERECVVVWEGERVCGVVCVCVYEWSEEG